MERETRKEKCERISNSSRKRKQLSTIVEPEIQSQNSQANSNKWNDEQIITAYERGWKAAEQQSLRINASHTTEEEEFRNVFKSFARSTPPKFDGTIGYEEADEWLAAVKSRFSVLRVPIDHQVELATYYSESSARLWWDDVKRNFKGDALRIPWERFQEQFSRRYLSTLNREAMRRQFMTLKQDGRPVPEYNNMFLDLSRHAPEVRDDPYRCMRQYLDGLDPEIAITVDNHYKKKGI